MIPTTSTPWTLILDDNPPVAVVDLTDGPVMREITVADWPFGPDPMPPVPRSYSAALQRHEGSAVVHRITGQAWSTGVAVVDDQGTRFRFRFVPDRIIDP